MMGVLGSESLMADAAGESATLRPKITSEVTKKALRGILDSTALNCPDGGGPYAWVLVWRVLYGGVEAGIRASLTCLTPAVVRPDHGSFGSLFNCAEFSSRLSEVAQALDAVSGTHSLIGGLRLGEPKPFTLFLPSRRVVGRLSVSRLFQQSLRSAWSGPKGSVFSARSKFSSSKELLCTLPNIAVAVPRR
jgi:hypothetical protein